MLDENEMIQTGVQFSDPCPSKTDVPVNAHFQNDASIRSAIEKLSSIYRFPVQKFKKTSKTEVLTRSPYRNKVCWKITLMDKQNQRDMLLIPCIAFYAPKRKKNNNLMHQM